MFSRRRPTDVNDFGELLIILRLVSSLDVALSRHAVLQELPPPTVFMLLALWSDRPRYFFYLCERYTSKLHQLNEHGSWSSDSKTTWR